MSSQPLASMWYAWIERRIAGHVGGGVALSVRPRCGGRRRGRATARSSGIALLLAGTPRWGRRIAGWLPPPLAVDVAADSTARVMTTGSGRSCGTRWTSGAGGVDGAARARRRRPRPVHTGSVGTRRASTRRRRTPSPRRPSSSALHERRPLGPPTVAPARGPPPPPRGRGVVDPDHLERLHAGPTGPGPGRRAPAPATRRLTRCPPAVDLRPRSRRCRRHVARHRRRRPARSAPRRGTPPAAGRPGAKRPPLAVEW